LASSRGTSNGPDMLDLAAVVDAMERTNGIVITISMRTVKSGLYPCLSVLMEAHDQDHEIGEVPTLAYVRLTTGSHDLRTMEAAIMQSLYKLDAELAAIELRSTNEPRAQLPGQ